MFKAGTTTALEADEDDDRERTRGESFNQGTNLLREMQSKPHTFIIHINGKVHQYFYR
jgi:hypothetical protein